VPVARCAVAPVAVASLVSSGGPAAEPAMPLTGRSDQHRRKQKIAPSTVTTGGTATIRIPVVSATPASSAPRKYTAKMAICRSVSRFRLRGLYSSAAVMLLAIVLSVLVKTMVLRPDRPADRAATPWIPMPAAASRINPSRI
jgi:hypothetical protein